MSSLLNPTFLFYVEGTAGHARAGSMKTAHGVVKTPKLMPVGTQATVKALSSEDLSAMGADIILANTYHLYLRPGHDRVSKLGGIQRFMNWNRPMLTDSGGFQVFSLGKQMEAKQLSGGGERTSLTHITDDGVEFVSHLDGSKHFFSPERAIEIQQALGADIIMAFDECTPDGATEDYAREALDRTHRWAARCKVVWEQKERKSSQGNYQALFGIIQGAMHEPLRKEAAKYITDLKLDGIAFGGETIGYNMEGTLRVMEWVRSLLPVNVPRYAMGLGRDPQDILDAVR
ncbi:MAG TPA: tRNA guanosine(34) transglycosylase Tgt, partial [Patescibacteria group bacterium]|nr:tRNA guanosine(34) transglycosylase Tgt [Patescibacteria group bacterium]